MIEYSEKYVLNLMVDKNVQLLFQTLIFLSKFWILFECFASNAYVEKMNAIQ